MTEAKLEIKSETKAQTMPEIKLEAKTETMPEIFIQPEIYKPYEELKIGNEIEVHYNGNIEPFTVFGKRVSASGAPLIAVHNGHDVKYLASNNVGVLTLIGKYALATHIDSKWTIVSRRIRVFLTEKK